jgi:glycosyltransferase involved in cell wall biosynthesis
MRTVIHPGQGTPAASVLFLSCDRRAWVDQAVRSILDQAGITLEIILSDDASTDGSFRILEKRARAYRGPHRVVLRRSEKRLSFDHLDVLAAEASCDILIQAHDDDISHPNRCRRLTDAILETGAAGACSNVRQIDGNGHPIDVKTGAWKTGWISVEEMLSETWIMPMLGAALAWRRSRHALLPLFDARLLPVGHDTAMSFRNGILGGHYYLDEPLVDYRQHATNWTRVIYYGKTKPILQESSLARAIMARRMLAHDLRHLLSHPECTGPEKERQEQLLLLCTQDLDRRMEAWLLLRSELYLAGWRWDWIHDSALRKKYRRPLSWLHSGQTRRRLKKIRDYFKAAPR